MEKYLFIYFFSVCSITSLFGQTEIWDEYLESNVNNGLQKTKTIQSVPLTVRRSEDGYDFPTKGTYRMLTIFINIIYDGSYSPLPHESFRVVLYYWRLHCYF